MDKVKDALAKCQVGSQLFGYDSIAVSFHNWILLTPFVTQPAGGGFLTAHELGQQRKRVMKISTGSKQFDEILGG